MRSLMMMRSINKRQEQLVSKVFRRVRLFVPENDEQEESYLLLPHLGAVKKLELYNISGTAYQLKYL